MPIGWTAEEGIPSKPPADNWSWALPGLSPAPWSWVWDSQLHGEPAHSWRWWEGRPSYPSLMFHIHKICNLFKKKSTAHVLSVCVRIALLQTACCVWRWALISFLHKIMFISFKKTPFLFYGAAIPQHLTSFGQICQSSLGKRIKKNLSTILIPNQSVLSREEKLHNSHVNTYLVGTARYKPQGNGFLTFVPELWVSTFQVFNFSCERNLEGCGSLRSHSTSLSHCRVLADDMNTSQVRESLDLFAKFVPFSHLEISSLALRFVRVHYHLEQICLYWCKWMHWI